MWFSAETFYQMMVSGWVVDGRGGGLVIGRSHDDGNIYMIQESGGKFIIPGSLEGGEYIVNFDAYSAHKQRIEKINEYKANHPLLESVKISPKTKVLNTHSEPNDKLLWIDTRGQFIINKHATHKHFDELEEINNIVNGFINCDLNCLVPKDDA